MPRYKLLTFGLSALVILATVLACSVADGDRASTGECPEEECVEGFDGLSFYNVGIGGAEPSSTLYPVAVGGLATIAIIRTVGVLEEAPTFDVVGTALSYVGPGTSSHSEADTSADIRGVAAGDALVRVTNASGLLYDRITYSARRIVRVDSVLSGREDESPYFESGGSASLVFRLLDASGNRLIDESMTIAADHGYETVSWDSIRVRAGDVSEIAFALTAGGARWDVVVPVR